MTDQIFTHNFYDLDWCLFCHKLGHRSGDCSEGQPVVVPEENAWDLFARVEFHPDETSIDKFANLIKIQDALERQYVSYKSSRDALLTRVYDDMANRNVPEGREYWFRRMSQWNGIVERGLASIMEPVKVVKERLDAAKYFDESIHDYLTRLPNEKGESDAAKWLREIETSLAERRNLDQQHRQILVEHTKPTEEHCPDIMSLDAEDKEWMCRAFVLLYEVQPVFEDSAQGITSYKFPDLDTVVQSTGIDL